MNLLLEMVKERFQTFGVNVEAALMKLDNIEIALHSWQGGDEAGFSADAPLTPGKLKNFDEFTRGFKTAASLIPGKKRLGLLASYALEDKKHYDRNELRCEQADGWIDFAREIGIGLDFSSTFICHPKSEDYLTLAHPDKDVRDFWVEHGRCGRSIAQYIAEKTEDTVLHNIWVIDGFRQEPADRVGPRERLKESLDRILKDNMENVLDAVECKAFTNGVESATVGSYDFYLSYALTHNHVYPLIDNGHFFRGEPAEDKISALMPYFDWLPVHFTKSVQGDSEHTVLLDDQTQRFADAIVSSGALDKVKIGLDYYDPRFPRVASWVLAARSVQKAILVALLTPWEELKKYQSQRDYGSMVVLREQVRSLPWAVIWDEYCREKGVPEEDQWYKALLKTQSQEG